MLRLSSTLSHKSSTSWVTRRSGQRKGSYSTEMPLGIIFVLHSSFSWSSKFSGSKYRRLNGLTSTRSSWPLTFWSWNDYHDKPGLFRIANKTQRQRGNCRARLTGFAPDNLTCLFFPEGQTRIKSYLDLIWIWDTLNDKCKWGLRE